MIASEGLLAEMKTSVTQCAVWCLQWQSSRHYIKALLDELQNWPDVTTAGCELLLVIFF